jgi:ArsR family transcriptional regulator
MEQIVQVFRALSEEMRLRILLLLTREELCVCDLMTIFDEPQSKISRHLAYLKNSGLISSRRVGVWMHYFLKDRADDFSQAQIELLRQRLNGFSRFQQDVSKMKEVLARKLCEAEPEEQETRPSGGKPARRNRRP